MTTEETKAIKQLEAAFKNASKQGIKVCGMDGRLYYATKQAYKQGTVLRNSLIKRDPYCEVAEAIKANVEGSYTLETFDVYTDSGGW